MPKKKPTKDIDPTKPLLNHKHETFAKIIAKHPNLSQDKAYLSVYPESSLESSIANASRLINSDNVRARVMALLDQVNAGLPRASQKLKEHLESDTESISLDATKTIFKLAGAMDDVKGEGNAVYNPVQVIIQQMTVNPLPQPIDTTIDTTTNE